MPDQIPPTVSGSTPYSDADIVAAMRLAVEAAATDSAARAAVVELLNLAAPSCPSATAPVDALIVAIKAAGLGFEVTDA